MIYVPFYGNGSVGKGDLLLHFDGDFVDSSPKNRTLTAYGGISTSTAHPAWGTEGLEGDGFGWLETPDDGAFDIGTRKFSVDFQIYITSAAILNTDNIIIGKWGLSDGSWFVNLFQDGRINIGRRSSGNYFFNSLTGVLARDTLLHIAVWKPSVGGDFYGAVDGVIGSNIGSATTVDSTSNDVGIGAVVGGGAKLPVGVFVDELRYLVDDDVEYGTGNFTPPTGPY